MQSGRRPHLPHAGTGGSRANECTPRPENPRTNAPVFFGVEPGSELGWGMSSSGPEPFSAATDQFRYVVFKDPEWDWHTLNLDSDVALADKIDNDTINAVNPNMKTFLAHGGKLLMYHGWADPGVPPLASVNYYKTAVDSCGWRSQDCGFHSPVHGPRHGPLRRRRRPQHVRHDERDRRNGGRRATRPARIIASHRTAGQVDRTRPLCPYPQVAKYKGAGSIDDEANFACELPSSAVTK